MSNLKHYCEILSTFYQAFARRDVETIMKLIDERIVVTQTELLPWGGEYHGHAGLQNFFMNLLSKVDSRVEPERFIEAENRVVAIGRTIGTVGKNKLPFDVQVAHVWEFCEGRAVRFEAYIDTPEMLRLLNREK